jgi:hypothetical protein
MLLFYHAFVPNPFRFRSSCVPVLPIFSFFCEKRENILLFPQKEHRRRGLIFPAFSGVIFRF